jgi:hypothetical protein
MKLSEFKSLYKKYSGKLSAAEWQTPEYDEYIHALNDSKECKDWYLLQEIKKVGINPKRHCCLQIAYRMIEDKKEKLQLKTDHEYINYDSVITYCKSQKSFGIPIHDGGSSFIRIKYCPWCAKKLDKYPLPSKSS